MSRWSLLPALALFACSQLPTFKPAGSVSFTARASSFGRSTLDAGFDPLSAPMIVLTSGAAPSCSGDDQITMPSAADTALVINLYDTSESAGFLPITPGDYAISTDQSGRVAAANYYERCASKPFSVNATSGVVHVMQADPDTHTLEGTYELSFPATQGYAAGKMTGSFGTRHCGEYDSAMSWGTCQ